MKNKRCLGIVGTFFGHSFEHIYDIDKRPVNAEELQMATDAVSRYNLWNWSNSMNPDSIPTENVTKVYQHSICKRCGLTINREKMVI